MHSRTLFFTAFSLIVSGLAHALLAKWLFDAFPRTKKHQRAILGVLAAFVILPSLMRIVSVATHSQIAVALFVACMCESIVVLFSAIPNVIVRIAASLASRPGAGGSKGGLALEPPFAEAASAEGGARGASAPRTRQDTRREFIERVGGIGFLGATGSLVGWGAVIGRHDFRIEEVPVRIVGLPRALDGYTITQISDIHVGMLVGEKELAEGLDVLARAKGDLVVLTGDMLDFDPRYIPLAARTLGGIRARDGVFAIFGNHDHYTGAAEVATALRAANIDVLVNDGRVIRAGDGGGFALLGVDDLAAIRAGGPGPRLDRAESAVPKEIPRILLSHQPQTVELWSNRVALQLSGHTHGGQFNPGFRPADLIMRYVAGRYEVGKTTLWVNRGFGVVGPPARVGAPPEVTKIILVSA